MTEIGRSLYLHLDDSPSAPPENPKFHGVKYESARLCERVAPGQTLGSVSADFR